MDGVQALSYILDNNIEGAIVECGVFDANFEFMWIQELKRRNVVRDIYMYDTFEGLPEPCEYDYTTNTASIYQMDAKQVHDYWAAQKIDDKKNNWCLCPLEKVQQRLRSTNYPEENLHYVVGDVMQTLNETVPDKIALLRLDTDWYTSSLFELEKLYDKVAENGVIIFDDYFHWDGQRRATDEYFKKINKEYIIQPLHNCKTGSIIKTS
jgi:O-methyltransferase